MSAHTPGPWRVGYWSGRCHKPEHAGGHPGSSGKNPCVYVDEFTDGDEDYVGGIGGPGGTQVVGASYDELSIDMADARLIAAAPELLEALMGMVAQHGCECGHPACKRCRETRDAKAIIAKATGDARGTREGA